MSAMTNTEAFEQAAMEAAGMTDQELADTAASLRRPGITRDEYRLRMAVEDETENRNRARFLDTARRTR